MKNLIPFSLFLFTFTISGVAETWTVSPRPLSSLPAENQFRTISEAVTKAEPGDTIEIHTGIYRESVVIPATKSGTAERPLRLVAAPTAEVVLTGSDLLTQWRAEPELGEYVVSTEWTHRFGGPHPNDLEHRVIGRAEQVFIDRYPQRQVFEVQHLAPGTFHVDLENRRLYLRDAKSTEQRNYASLHVEASVRARMLQVDASHVHLKGLRLRHCANLAQSGMALFRGADLLIEDCIFEYANSMGARFEGINTTVRRCRFLHNGQQGFSAVHAHGFRFEECLVAENNTKNYSRGWEAGGNKVVLCRDVVIERSVFRDNRGVGLWFDIGTELCVVRNCLFLHNEGHGLFYEIGYTMHAHDNVIIGNGIGAPDRSWGHGSGIFLSDSMGCIIERNLIIGNAGAGFAYREQRRTTPRLDTPETSPDKNPIGWLRATEPNRRNPEYWIWNRDHTVRNNIFAYNESAQLHGWFDVRDARHWSQARQREMLPRQSEGVLLDDPVTSPYQARAGEEPVGRSLENLELRHENNFFARSGNQRLFVWGVPWQRFVEYTDLAKVSEELLGLETGSREGSLIFADYHALDLRIPANADEKIKASYPRGEVPLVRLGTVER
ncbi:MAG: right-handed parallel beta-helix repeat-containing protein [Planctomycetaceae bacterium]|nr:right-handed parallel beta-helix repeat-containing protein [Planctomycetaceae bacterium]